MTCAEVMAALKEMGNEKTKPMYMKHGAREPFYAVKVADLKKIVKKVKKNYELSLELYDTGNSDAMYLAGLIADEKQMTKADLQKWKEGAYWHMLSEYTVPWVTSETEFATELALEWIDADDEKSEVAGWATLSCISALKNDEDLDIEMYSQLLDRAAENVHTAKNRVRYTMNGFIISTGSNIAALTEKAQKLGAKVGKVSVNMGETACKVPLAETYIQKVIDKNRVGKKRKTCRC